jgi:hypothetical protein
MNSSILQPSATLILEAETGQKINVPSKTGFIFYFILLSFLAISNLALGQIKPDKTPPDLQVAGPDTTIIEVTKNPMHPVPVPKVISAYDSVDGPLQGSVIIDSGIVQTNILKVYKVSYTVSDLSGNTAVVYRYVNIIDTIRPVIKLIGQNPAIVEVYNSYSERGVSVTDNYNTATQLNPRIKITSNVDTARIGTYFVTYKVTDLSGNVADSVTRTVKIVDSLDPVINLIGPSLDSVEVFSTYNDRGISVNDNYDSSSQLSIIKTGTYYAKFPAGKATILGSYTIIYTVTDKSGNRSSVTRTLLVKDKIPPVITLKGNAAVSICQGASYVDPGFNYSDNYDSIPMLMVKVEGSFLLNGTANPGVYSIRYKATDRSGNPHLIFPANPVPTRV